MIDKKKVLPLRPSLEFFAPAAEDASTPEAEDIHPSSRFFAPRSSTEENPAQGIEAFFARPRAPEPEYIPLRDNYADDGLLFPIMTRELYEAVDAENAKRQSRGERKMIGRAYTNFVAGLPPSMKYGERAPTSDELMEGMQTAQRLSLVRDHAQMNRERRQRGEEPIGLGEHVREIKAKEAEERRQRLAHQLQVLNATRQEAGSEPITMEDYTAGKRE